jgi:regulator of protease activity HflC (stomatin/prohibitin superfamily)
MDLFLLSLIMLGGLYTIAAVKIVPQTQKWVVERLGKYRQVLGPGVNLIVPIIDRVPHKVVILERQLPTSTQEAITQDNVVVQLETSIFYRITEPERTVYRIDDINGAISTTVAGMVRSEVGRMELDTVQSNRTELIEAIQRALKDAVEIWGIEVTRTEILDVHLDSATLEAMLQQLNAERARRAAVAEAEGQKKAAELKADGDYYAAQREADSRRVQADAEAYANQVVGNSISENGIEAAQFQIALKQVEALSGISGQEGNHTVLLPSSAFDAFSEAFKQFSGRISK